MISPIVKKKKKRKQHCWACSHKKCCQIFFHPTNLYPSIIICGNKSQCTTKMIFFFFFIIIIGSFNNWNGERNLVMRFDNETNFCYWFVFSKLQILDKWLSTFKYHVYTSLDLSNYNWLNLNKYFFFLQYINTVYPLFVFCISTMFVLKKILIFGLRNNTLVLNFC